MSPETFVTIASFRHPQIDCPKIVARYPVRHIGWMIIETKTTGVHYIEKHGLPRRMRSARLRREQREAREREREERDLSAQVWYIGSKGLAAKR